MTTEILLDQITSISKAHAYDVIQPEYKRLQDENKKLRENLSRIIDRIKENNLQDQFPSAFERAEAAIKQPV